MARRAWRTSWTDGLCSRPNHEAPFRVHRRAAILLLAARLRAYRSRLGLVAGGRPAFVGAPLRRNAGTHFLDGVVDLDDPVPVHRHLPPPARQPLAQEAAPSRLLVPPRRPSSGALRPTRPPAPLGRHQGRSRPLAILPHR